MASLELINLQRMGRVGIFLCTAKCQACDYQAFDDSYGSYACKKCLRELFFTITHRSEYFCMLKAKCWELEDKSNCEYCVMEGIYGSQLNPLTFGRHDNSYFMKDNIINLRKAQTIEPLTSNEMLEVMSFEAHLKKMAPVLRLWLKFNPLDGGILNNEQLDEYVAKYENRGLALQMAEEAMGIHDVLKVDFKYYDPYKCQMAVLQFLSLEILELARMLREEFSNLRLRRRIKKSLLYFAGVMKEQQNTKLDKFHAKLAVITFWMKAFKNLLAEYELKDRLDKESSSTPPPVPPRNLKSFQ